MAKKSKTEFFNSKADYVARRLIGRTIERYVAGQEQPISARIVVTGAYEGLTAYFRQSQKGFSCPI